MPVSERDTQQRNVEVYTAEERKAFDLRTSPPMPASIGSAEEDDGGSPLRRFPHPLQVIPSSSRAPRGERDAFFPHADG